MLPILFSVGPVKIYSFGVMVALGFTYFSFVAWRRLRELGFNQEKIIDLLILLAFLGWIGARVVWVAFWGFGEQMSLRELLNVKQYPGLSLGGGLISGAIGVRFFAKKNHWDLAKAADELVMAFGPMMVLWSLGSFLSGSSFGRPTGAVWGIFFPGDLIRRQPVDVFGAVWYLLIWLFLLKTERTWRTWKWYRSKRPGLIALLFAGLVLLGGFGLAFLTENDLYLSGIIGVLSLVGAVGVAGVVFYRSGAKINFKYNLKRASNKSESFK